MAIVEIPARKGKAARVRKGQTVKVINTRGQQVVDSWAFNAEDIREFMSMEHSRVSIGGILPKIGSVFVTNKRRPILTVIEDTSGGIHDTLIAACDRYRYEGSGAPNITTTAPTIWRPGSPAGPDSAGDAVALEPVHEYPGHRRERYRVSPPGQYT